MTIERFAITQDEIGTPVEGWSTQYSVWAEIIPTGAKEQLQFGREQTDETARMYIDYYADITTKDRVNYSSQLWDIESVKELGRLESLELLVRRRR